MVKRRKGGEHKWCRYKDSRTRCRLVHLIFSFSTAEYCNMCQIVNGNRNDVEDFSTLLPPRRIRQKLHRMGNPADILLCPVMGKIALPPDGLDGLDQTSGRRPSLSATLINGGEEKHSCSVCMAFLDKGLTATSSAPSQYSEVTALSVLNVLRRSTQPAHLVVMSAVLILAFMFYPTTKPMDYVTEEIQSESTLWPLLYLSSFSILFGAQMWMTFVSGLVLLFILPRHTFACVQGALFPKYMILNGVTALAVLVSFVQTKRVWSSQENYQVVGLIINWLCPLITRIIVVPSLLDRIRAKVILERAAGHGPEAGPKLTSFTEATLKQCLTYRQTCRRFRQLHAIVAIVNIVTLACNAFHLYYLSSKISFHH